MKKITWMSALVVWVLIILLGAILNPNYYSYMLEETGLAYMFGSAIGELLILIAIAWVIEKIALFINSKRKKGVIT